MFLKTSHYAVKNWGHVERSQPRGGVLVNSLSWSLSWQILSTTRREFSSDSNSRPCLTRTEWEILSDNHLAEPSQPLEPWTMIHKFSLYATMFKMVCYAAIPEFTVTCSNVYSRHQTITPPKLNSVTKMAPSFLLSWLTKHYPILALFLLFPASLSLLIALSSWQKPRLKNLSHSWPIFLIRSDQTSHLVMSDSLRPHESQHARPPCPSPTPRVHSDSHPSSQWCHQPSHPLSSPSPPAPNPSQHQSLFQWVNSSHEVAKVLEFQL